MVRIPIVLKGREARSTISEGSQRGNMRRATRKHSNDYLSSQYSSLNCRYQQYHYQERENLRSFHHQPESMQYISHTKLR